MHRYSLEFSAKTLDESRLRDVLEREFQLAGIVIVRTSSGSLVGPVKLQGTISLLESRILDLLSDRTPWRRKRVLEKAQNLGSAQEIYAVLRRLESRGAIKKARHGVYLTADAPQPNEKEIPPMNMTVDRPSYDKAVELLREPKSAVELQEALGVSRQRVDQIVKSLMRKGTVRRLEASGGERGSYIYVLSNMDRSLSILIRNPRFMSQEQDCYRRSHLTF